MKKKILLISTLFAAKAFGQDTSGGYSPVDLLNASDIRDIKEPFLLTTNSYFLFTVLGIVFLFFVFKGLLKFIQRIKKDRQARRRDPFEVWFEKLTELHDSDLWDKGRIKEFYEALSDIVRHYLEDRFYLRAPEMTTEEFLQMLQESNEIRNEHKFLLKDFLEHCDLVKFAKYGPDKSETEQTYCSAVTLFKETKPDVGEKGNINDMEEE